MEPNHDAQGVARLLRESRRGGLAAAEELMSIVYRKLQQLAARSLRSERKDQTLQPTALVHEAWLRLVNTNVDWQDRVHFYATAARLMRWILVDQARMASRGKRGGGSDRIELEDAIVVTPDRFDKLLIVNDALDRLGEHDARRRDILELVLCGGLSYEETSTALNVSAATVHRELKLAKEWLQRELSGQQSASA
jgi:RNA polymerase sigma factor (TIGR02999 family)